MTENEIINRLHLHGETMTQDEAFFIMDCLEKIQQYRAIGTVEEIQQKLKNMSLVIDTDRDLLNRYIAIGTIEEFKALKEKSVAKKPLHNGANWYRCPNGCEVHKKQFEKDWYCPKCGTKIDWSE